MTTESREVVGPRYSRPPCSGEQSVVLKSRPGAKQDGEPIPHGHNGANRHASRQGSHARSRGTSRPGASRDRYG
jgi:hypothetical protein